MGRPFLLENNPGGEKVEGTEGVNREMPPASPTSLAVTVCYAVRGRRCGWAADVWMASHQQRSRAVTWVSQGERGGGEGISYLHRDPSPCSGPHTVKGTYQNGKSTVHSGVNLVPITKESGLSSHKPVGWLICHRGRDGLRLLIDTKDVGFDGPQVSLEAWR